MRNLIILQQKRYKNNNTIIPTPLSNQLKEIDYFNAYFLPLSQKSELQNALDTYGSVRLDRGDYSGVNILMSSNQKLYGHPSLSGISNITIVEGSQNITVEYLTFADNKLIFQAGLPISNCTLNTLKYVYVEGINALIENNKLINISGQIKFDCSVSGYFRNNKIIKHQAQGISNQLVMKGNAISPSYGNVHLHTNLLTPAGDAMDIDNLQSSTFVGLDSEGWNLNGVGEKAMLYAKNIGDLKVTDFGGGNAYSAIQTGAFDVDANNFLLFNKYLRVPSLDLISSKTNIGTFGGEGSYNREEGTPIGFDLLAHINNSGDNYAMSYGGVEQTSTINSLIDITKIKNSLVQTQHTPWTKPSWETLPDPLGVNWKINRIGKPDQRAFLQNLINTNGIAELPEGVFYISSTLNIPLDNGHGIVGKGTAKTIIVGLTDDFPLITIGFGSTQNLTLSYLTLQGGSKGLYFNQYATQLAYQNIKFVVFREQESAISLKNIMGFDNNFFENIGFVNCSKAVHQEPLLPYVGELETSSYIDKTVFYNSQFIGCDIPISMQGTRPNNLDAWIDCKFSNGTKAFDLGAMNYPIIANCDVSGYVGDVLISSNDISIYATDVHNNTMTVSTINAVNSYLEGNTFSDTDDLFSSVMYNKTDAFIYNCTVVGNAINPPFNEYNQCSAVYINSTLSANTTLSKLLVNVKEGISTVVIDESPTPYPQLLVTQ